MEITGSLKLFLVTHRWSSGCLELWNKWPVWREWMGCSFKTCWFGRDYFSKHKDACLRPGVFRGGSFFQPRGEKNLSGLNVRKCCLNLKSDSQTGETHAVTSSGVAYDSARQTAVLLARADSPVCLSHTAWENYLSWDAHIPSVNMKRTAKLDTGHWWVQSEVSVCYSNVTKKL